MSMSAYVLGEPIHLTASFTTLAGTPTDTKVALKVRTPDGIETDETANVEHDGAAGSGTYHCDFTPTLAGDHFVRWVGSGALVAAYEEQFYVLRSAM